MIKMICKDCSKFREIANTDECGQGICAYPMSYMPVDKDAECMFIPKPYTCGDCDRLGNDTACFTCRAEDSAYNDGKLCAGFIDIKEEAVKDALADWTLRGYNIEDKLKEILEEFKENFTLPWESSKNLLTK